MRENSLHEKDFQKEGKPDGGAGGGQKKISLIRITITHQPAGRDSR